MRAKSEFYSKRLFCSLIVRLSERESVVKEKDSSLPVTELSKRWKYSPEFLKLPKEEWPVESSKPDSEKVEKEWRKAKLVGNHWGEHTMSNQLWKVFQLEKTCASYSLGLKNKIKISKRDSTNKRELCENFLG